MCRRSRKQVLVAGKELDYQMNMMAREFSSNRTLLLGLIAPFRGLLGTFFYFGWVLQGVQQGVSGTGCHMVLFDSQWGDVNCA
jgi:DNA-binding LacI/PurR family transcriptional regulator